MIIRGKPKKPGENLLQCHFVDYEPHLGLNPRFRDENTASNYLMKNHGTTNTTKSSGKNYFP
jgi:hypothetical protein